jgi:hypothetical protein
MRSVWSYWLIMVHESLGIRMTLVARPQSISATVSRSWHDVLLAPYERVLRRA